MSTRRHAPVNLLGAVFTVLLGVICVGGDGLGARDGTSGSREYLLRVAESNLTTVTARHGLRIDPDRRRSGDLHVVRDESDRDELVLQTELLGDADVQGFEHNRDLVLPEVPAGLALNASTAAILEQVNGATVDVFAGQAVWSPYVDQAAMSVIKVPAAHAQQRTGAGIVALIDTGIDPVHPVLRGVLVDGYDFTRNVAGLPSELADLSASTAAILEASTAAILERRAIAALNASTAAILENAVDSQIQALLPGDRPPAAFGHGTMTAGLVHRVAPTARIMPLKAFRGDGSSSLFDIVRAIHHAVDHGARVINMSFSVPSESPELKRALDYAESNGVVCISSAGNEGQKTRVYPARWSEALGVGSTTTADERSTFSNFGDDIFEVGAPGEALITTWPGQRYAAAWGTSFSTAIVSGAAALLVDPTIAPRSALADSEADIIVEALRNGKRLGRDLGKGRIDLDIAVAYRGGFDASAGTLPDPVGDDDHDTVSNELELRYGLNILRNDAAEDADGDGVANAVEVVNGTHPRGFWSAYLAEGATGNFFETTIALANPSPTTTAKVLLRFHPATGGQIARFVEIPPLARRTVNVAHELSELVSAEFSTVVESDVPLGTDRTMTWTSSAYGSDAERGITARPGATWYLAEGATHSGFELFYLLQNPGTTDASVDLTFLRPAPHAPVETTETVPAGSRRTVWVNRVPGLEATDVSGVVRVRSGGGILVERAMYRNAGGQIFGAGHEAAAVPSPAAHWFFAEGATGSYFDTFLLLANPDARVADVRVTFLRPTGTPLVKHVQIAPQSRANVWVNVADAALADTPVSTIVESTNGVPVVAERAMWWPRGAWFEAHDSAGSTETGTRWILAEGEVGGSRGQETYVLIANTGTSAGSARVTLLFEDGTNVQKTLALPAQSRTNVSIRDEFPAAANRRFGTLIESLGQTPAPLVVERAMYGNAEGVTWASGSNALATKLPE